MTILSNKVPRFGETTTGFSPIELLRGYLDHYGLSEYQFSKKYDIPNATLNSILNSRRPAPTDIAAKIESVTGIEAIDFFIHWEEKAFSEKLERYRQKVFDASAAIE